MALKLIGTFTIDTGFNEPAWADPQSWIYEAKVTPVTTFHTPAQPNDQALYNIFCEPKVARGRTIYQTGSTSFPPNIGDRRIYIICAVWIDFLRPENAFTGVDLRSVDWQLVRLS
jgi:hypothetical protein